MKNINIIINGVLLLCIAVLFYLHFSGRPDEPAEQSSVMQDIKIAFIKSDSVLMHYDYLKVARDKIEAKGKKIEQDMKNRAVSLQTEIEAYQRNVNNMTIGQAKAIEEDLGKKQQNFQMYRESVSQELMADQDKLNKELYEKVTAFLKEYGSKKGLQIVMKFDQTSDLLYAGDFLDISKDVIAGLNEAYKKEMESTKVKNQTDSARQKK